MLFEIALTVNPLAFYFGILRGLRTCASAFAGGLSSSITVWAVVVKTRIRTDSMPRLEKRASCRQIPSFSLLINVFEALMKGGSRLVVIPRSARARSGITLMEAPGSISTRGSLLSFADVTGEKKRPLMYASSCPARCLLSRRLYLHSGLSSLVLPCTHLRCFELPPNPRNQIRIFFSLFRWGKAKREDFRKKASSADDLEGRQGKTETTDTEPGLMKDHRIDTRLVSMPASLRSIKGAVQ
ncbi:hypothetical protein VNO78_35149 [Psophocarpus tetragonolobus]|uniref:Uncharacterized protein n=1 Tax=Psophocarpus tetragonolobus TaxID=3891 RepID=A0AAN9NN69_PSOTE